MENRRDVLALLGAASLDAMAVSRSQAAAATGQLPAWVAQHVTAVRSIDFTDEDFSDLEPLADAIGTARLVQLGEPSHGAGSAFAAKARIVKFLYLKHGFDVLVWESGLYDVTLAQAAMRDPALDAMAAARKGIFALWSQAAEVKPLFELIKASQATTRPMTMAGFDMQVTADGTRELFADDLKKLAADLRPSPLREQVTALVEAATGARARLYASKFSDSRDLDALKAATGTLQKLLNTRADFAAIRGALDIAFLDRTIGNMAADAMLRTEAARAPQTTPARESRRDAWNAANLRCLLERPYAGRRVIVWAHNVHVMNAWYAPGFRDLHLAPKPGDMKTTGVFMKDWLGDKVYNIGITTFAGEEGFAMGGPRSAIAPAPDTSLENRLHARGDAFAFLDLRAARRAHKPLVVRTPKFDVNLLPDAGQVFDGLFFIDQMKAATRA